jgi:hypothetical protein
MLRLYSLASGLVLLLTPNSNEAFTQFHSSRSSTTLPSVTTRKILNRPPSSLQSSRQSFPRLPRRQRRSYLGSSTTSADADADDDESSSSRTWTRWITGVANPQRPAWARDWMPTWLVRLRPCLQLVTVLLFYIFHMTVLAQHSLPFPVQLIPNERGHFQSIGLDS